MHGIETPENTRRQCLNTLDDLRDLMNRDASRHPPRITEKRAGSSDRCNT